MPAATSRHDNSSIARAEEPIYRAPPVSHSMIDSMVSWPGRSATARSTTSVTMTLRPSTISEEDTASPKRSLPGNPRGLDLRQANRRGRIRGAVTPNHPYASLISPTRRSGEVAANTGAERAGNLGQKSGHGGRHLRAEQFSHL